MARSYVYRPDYTIKQYREGYYKLIRFNRGDNVSFADHKKEVSHDEKLSAAISRARSMIAQLIICNDWDWFFTGTLNGSLHDRNNLYSFRSRFTQWIRDLNKRPGYNISYVLVPERHESGEWHMHGVIRGLPPEALCGFIRGIHPRKLVEAGYVNWPEYSKKFGFCSLDRVQDPIRVGHYLQKYISKDMSRAVTEVGGHTYYCSRGLARAVPFGNVYGRFLELDELLQTDYDFCSTGMVNANWHFWLPYVELDGCLFDDGVYGSISSCPPLESSEGCPEWENMLLFGFSGG